MLNRHLALPRYPMGDKGPGHAWMHEKYGFTDEG